jgi:hypothetical protein
MFGVKNAPKERRTENDGPDNRGNEGKPLEQGKVLFNLLFHGHHLPKHSVTTAG